MIAELIGAGASLLGSLFGGKKKSQETTTRVDYGRMARDAAAAGFNPLTAIRNGGSAGFTTTTSPTISNTPEILSNLGGVLGQALGDKLDPINAKKREIDTLLVDRQLRQLKEGPQIAGSFNVPRTYSGTKVSQQLVPRLGATSHKQTAAVPAAFKSDMGYTKDDTPKVKNPYPAGILPDPNTPNADDIETRLGDDFFSPGFWYVGGNDLRYNLQRKGFPTGPYDAGRQIRSVLNRKPAPGGSGAGARMGRMVPYHKSGGGGGGW